ncbi:DUF2125 domain-containing protein [Jannaschia sp. KMU-145]|uniref:DUF2125 domain-containing protein n=1 Tax=Jannaschia halovivens TaxID=3388667 RepID=UPI00396B0D4F
MSRHAAAGAAALLLTTAPAAWADLSAEAVWADWQALYERFGGQLTATSESYEGGVLTLEGVQLGSDLAGAEMTSSGVGPIRLIEQSDGSLTVEIPERIPFETTTTVDDETITQSGEMTLAGTDLVIREAGAGRTYDMTADAFTYVFDVPETENQEETAVSMTMRDIASTYTSGQGGSATSFVQDLTASGMAVIIGVEGEDSMDVTYEMTGITSSFAGDYGEGTVEPGASLSDLGLTYGGALAHTGSTLSVAGTGGSGPLQIDGTSEAGSIDIDLTAEKLGYTVTSTGGQVTAQVPQFPLPIAISMDELRSGFAMPIGAGPEERPFGLDIAMMNLVVDDALWSLFDPTGQLPRDPATLIVDVDGSAVMTADIFGDPEAMAALGGPPGELKSATIDEIRLTVAGAELRADGAVTFPTPDPSQPVGTVNLALDGGNALLDALVALGFVPAQNAGFIRGMAGAVARPVGDDQLESKIEFTPGGGISANGMPLR